MSELHLFERNLSASWRPDQWCDVTTLVSVSGGADSLALLCGLTAVHGKGPGRLVAAHFNHGLRGAESDTDEAFVLGVCERLQVECRVGHAIGPDVGSRPFESEEGARNARYDFLCRTAQQTGARYVVTGHTADDQAETVLHRILRGTGVAGLAGIQRTRELLPGVSLIRPLLGIRRSQIREYLESIGQPFREDASNRDTRFTRNRIRHELLPRLAEDYNAHVVTAVNRLGRLAGEAQAVIDERVEELAAGCVAVRSDGSIAIDCKKLSSHHRYLVRELFLAIWRRQGWPLQSMNLQRWEELADLATAQEPPAGNKKHLFPGQVSARRSGTSLRLTGFAPNPEAGSAR